jgi:very-short-patch-repair endonuclease
MADPLTLRRRARRMRAEPTVAEKLLWDVLRQGKLAGLRFRRQVPIGAYIADFACFSPKLVVEADGEWFHRDREYDARRDAWLESQGFMVIRFKNKEVIGRQDHDATVILARTGRA